MSMSNYSSHHRAKFAATDQIVTNKPLLFLTTFRLKKETGPLGSIETAAIVEAIVEAILAQIKPEQVES